MRRRRPAPRIDTGTPVVPLPRAHLVRSEADDSSPSAASASKQRPRDTRSRFGKLTPTTSAPATDAALPQRPSVRAPARARRANAAPEPHDGWTFVLIPPGADARPRTLRVSVRRLRFVVASFCVVVSTTLAAGGLLVLALSFLPPAQDEVRGVELGVFASAMSELASESAGAESLSTPAAIAAASAGAAAPRTTAARPRPRVTRGAADGGSRTASGVSPGILESLPVVGEITSRFARARRHPLLGVVRKHAGIDIAAPAGTHITAPADGRITFSGRKFGYGYTVEIDHGNGVKTRYAHCRSLMVRAGDEVAQGALIATVGRSGLATAPHLHYEVLVRGRSVDPLRNPLASLLAGKEAPATVAIPQPVDSALRAPVPDVPDPDEPDASDIPDVLDLPEITVSTGDTAAIRTPPIARTSAVTSPPPTTTLPAPAPATRDTARKS